jgi:glycerol uptake operon antiterminator
VVNSLNDLEEILADNPIIAAINTDEALKKVLVSKAQIVFVIYGNILNIENICKSLKEAGKTIFVHMDMIEGIKGDSKGIEFIKQVANPDGIITTKQSNVKYAVQLGLKTIERVFIIDSQSMKTGIKNINSVMPDAVEVMPGVASKIISKMQKDVHLPIIAGGLIETHSDIIEAISAGAVAISTSNSELWNVE